MTRKKTILLVILLAIIAAGFYGYHEYFRPNADMQDLPAAFRLQTKELLKEFELHDSLSTKKYLGKVVEVNGLVKAVEKDEKGYYTVVLGDSANRSSVRCSIDTVHMAEVTLLKQGSTIRIKGAFTGYNEDVTGLLGADIQLNRCIIDSKKE